MHKDEWYEDENNDDIFKGLNESAMVPQEWTVDYTVRHIGKGANVKYVIRWYGYTSTDDTVETTKHIPQHFITGYWWRVWGKGVWRR